MIEYQIDRPRRLLLVRMSGANHLTDLIRHFSKLLADPEWDPTFNTLFRLTAEATMPGVMLQQALLKPLLEQLAKRQQGERWAIVSPSQVQLGLVRVATADVRLPGVQMQLFDDEASALAWLGSASS